MHLNVTGYHIKLESKKSAKTRILLMTTGVLLRRLQASTQLFVSMCTHTLLCCIARTVPYCTYCTVSLSVVLCYVVLYCDELLLYIRYAKSKF